LVHLPTPSTDPIIRIKMWPPKQLQDMTFLELLFGEAGFWFCINVVGTGAGYWLAPKLRPKDAKSNRHSDADLIGSIPIFFPLVYFAIKHTCSHSHPVQTRWTETSPAAISFLWLYVMRQVVSFPGLFLGDLSLANKILMAVHHVASIICYGGGLATQRMHWYACLDGCCEVTTIFLNMLLLFRAIDYKGVFNSLNGVALWLSFILFRLVLFPCWLYQFYQDLNNYPGETTAKTTLFERTCYPATTILLLLMSAQWFVSITKGMLKALGMMKPKLKDKKEA